MLTHSIPSEVEVNELLYNKTNQLCAVSVWSTWVFPFSSMQEVQFWKIADDGSISSAHHTRSFPVSRNRLYGNLSRRLHLAANYYYLSVKWWNCVILQICSSFYLFRAVVADPRTSIISQQDFLRRESVSQGAFLLNN